MKFRNTIITSAALLTLAACGGAKDTSPANTMTTAEAGDTNMVTAEPVAASGAQAFSNAAAASDTFEIETSRLALTNGSAAAVKSYANKMIEAHTASTAKLKTTAASASPAVTPDATLSVDQQQKLDALKALNGTAFDKAYQTEQAAGHQQTLDALKAYAATGEAAPLKTFANEMIPIVTAHINMVKSLKI